GEGKIPLIESRRRARRRPPLRRGDARRHDFATTSPQILPTTSAKSTRAAPKNRIVVIVPRPERRHGGSMDAHAPSIEAYFPVSPAASESSAPSADTRSEEEQESAPSPLLVQQPSVPSLTASLLAEVEVFSPK